MSGRLRQVLLYWDLISDWDPDEVFPLLPPAEAERRRSLQNLRHVVSQAYDELDTLVVQVDLTKYVFPFENLVFEGGGNKGLAYCGAVRVSSVHIQFCCTHRCLNVWIFVTLSDAKRHSKYFEKITSQEKMKILTKTNHGKTFFISFRITLY